MPIKDSEAVELCTMIHDNEVSRKFRDYSVVAAGGKKPPLKAAFIFPRNDYTRY